jgi:putative peptidoglycan lipid II flippase
MVIPVPIVSVLFERGAFGPDDTVATALALAVYGAGLPAFVLQKVLQPLYFAREDTRPPSATRWSPWW